MIRYVIAFLIVLGTCFTVQSLALRACGGSTVKSESNYFSSIARIQTESRKKADIMLLGSSLTGRLADRGGKHDHVANLGCDGGSAVVTLRAIDSGLLPAAPLLIIETNTLGYGVEDRGSDIARAIDSSWFRLGNRVPNVSSTARPSAFFYSWLMARKKTEDTPLRETLPVTGHPVRLAPSPGQTLTAGEKKLTEELTSILSRLSQKGSRILLIQFPAGNLDDAILKNMPTALATHSGFPYWDLNIGLPPDAVQYTDGRHLDAASARKLMNTLLGERITP